MAEKETSTKAFFVCSEVLSEIAFIEVGKSFLTGFGSPIESITPESQHDSLNTEEAIELSQGSGFQNSYDSTLINEHLFDGDLLVEKSNPSNTAVARVDCVDESLTLLAGYQQ